ncbi:MAG: hypothetical protein HY735_25645 [Verrucomicrobia bacterium]|nr:hypothetical protein [Verrucomicrobiota bacterium]
MKTNEKIDLYKLHKEDYAAPRKPILLDIAEASYLVWCLRISYTFAARDF